MAGRAPATGTTRSTGFSLVILFATVLVASVAAVYANSVRGVFVYDDLPAIVENPTLRPPWSLRSLLFYPGDESGTLGGRPLVNLSLAFNRIAGGLDPAGYHLVNITIHALAALALFGVMRRTLARAVGAGWSERERTATAFLVALLWAVHPLHTEAVTFIVQRTESLLGLLYLAALYSFIRSLEARHPRGWQIACFVACLLGMTTKEVMVSAPLVMVAYDRMFVSRSWREVRARLGFYFALASTWVVLGLLVASTHGRGGTAGISAPGEVWPYLLTQARAIPHYLRLAFWPDRLVFDYGLVLEHRLAAVALPASLVLALLGLSAWALIRGRPAGFVGLVFFAVLAPSSSFVPILTEPVAEHRMYLPLAATTALIVVGVAAWVRSRPRGLGFVAVMAASAIAVALGAATVRRNQTYASAIALWADAVDQAPDNPRARNNLGQARLSAGDRSGAESDFRAATQIDAGYLPAQYNLGATLLDAGQPAEAIAFLERAQAAPRHRAETALYLGEAHEQLGQMAEAERCYRDSAVLEPSPEAAFGLGNVLAAQGRYADAVAPLRLARNLKPAAIDLRNNLANALLFSGQTDEAIAEFRAALALDPKNEVLQKNLALALEAKAPGIRP